MILKNFIILVNIIFMDYIQNYYLFYKNQLLLLLFILLLYKFEQSFFTYGMDYFQYYFLDFDYNCYCLYFH